MKPSPLPLPPRFGLFCAMAAVVSFLCCSVSARASLLISDAFEYGAVGGNLDAVTAVGSTGLSGNWIYTSVAKYWDYTASGGLSFGSYGSSGGATSFTQSNFAPSVVRREITTPLSSGTYYLGYLFAVSNRANNGSVGSLMLGPSAQTGNDSPAAVFSDEFGSDLGGSRVAGSGSLNSGTVSAADGTTYLSLSRITLDGVSLSIERYILTETQFEHFNSLSGGLDANLNQSIATGTASNQLFQKGSQTVGNGTISLPFLTLEGYANGGTYTFTYDEIRLSDSGFNTLPIPEPSSAVLLGGAALAMTGLLRRRRLTNPKV